MAFSMEIAGRKIGVGYLPYVIAEISGNHNGDIGRAKRLIEAAKVAGADAVKLQTYTADTLTIDHDGPGFVIEKGLWAGRKLYDLYREAHTPWEWHEPLFRHARDLGITCFSSAFDPRAVDLLESLGTPAHKIASFEIVDTPLIRYAARTGKPLVISTGMATMDEIADAVAAARDAGAKEIALLHCVSGYPTPAAQANLARIGMLAATFDCPIGLSDHTLSEAVSVASIALGTVIVEKHVTLLRADGGPDAEFSLEPGELARLVKGCRDAWWSLRPSDRDGNTAEDASVPLRRSLYVVKDIAAGAELTTDNIRSIRPGNGLSPKHLPHILGAHVVRPLKRGHPLAWNDISGAHIKNESESAKSGGTA
jgi:pseudaminic acid synthase